jgi:hypothetical protein
MLLCRYSSFALRQEQQWVPWRASQLSAPAFVSQEQLPLDFVMLDIQGAAG